MGRPTRMRRTVGGARGGGTGVRGVTSEMGCPLTERKWNVRNPFLTSVGKVVFHEP